jgi:carboxypeptidase family protein/TonB-dependent receptor-like protein
MMKGLTKRLPRSIVILVLAAALVHVAEPRYVHAQAVNGTLLGTISDTNDAVLPGASVTIIDVNTNIRRSTTTNESGNYVFGNLPQGTYRIEVERDGFKKFFHTGVDVQVNATVRKDLQLEPGSVSENVTVMAQEPALQTDRSDTGRLIEAKQVAELPLGFNRNFQGLIFTVPGSTRPSRPHSQFFNSQDSLESKVNGQSRLSNNVQIEGIDDNEKTGLLQVLIPAADAIESVSVTTSNFDAELGRAGGAVSTVTLKSGTNEIHGSVFGFGNNDNSQARDFFTAARAPSHYRQVGATIGGPIKKDKLFFFGDYQYTTDALGTVNQHTVPYTEWYNGDFRNAPTKIYDPATGNSDGTGRQQISCNGVLNVICPNRISQIARNLLAFLPGPNKAGAAFAQNNFIFNEVRVKTTHAFDVKINYSIDEKNSLSYRFSYERPTVFDPGTYGIYGGPTNGGFAGTGVQNTVSTAANYSHVFSPTLILEARFGLSWYHNVATSQGAGLKTSEEVGIKNVNTDDFSSGLTQININGFSAPVLGFSASVPWDRGETTYVASGIITKVKGNHTIKLGEEINKNRDFLLQIQDNGGVRGHFDFSGSRTAIPADSAAQNGLANAFAAFLLDLPGSVGRDIKVLDNPGTRHNSFFSFVQDRWQITKDLTLTLGLRHEYYTTLVGIADTGGLSNYDPSTNTALVAGYGSISSSAGVSSTWKNFAPRFGAAYRLNDKTVARIGYGTTVIPFPDNSYAFNFPVKQNNAFTATNSFLPAGSMAAGFPDKIVFNIPANGIIDGNNPVLKNSSLFAVPFDLREGRLHSWNVAIQRDLWWGFTGEAAYVGNVGRGIVDRLDLNAATALGAGLPGNDNAARPLFKKFGRSASVTTWTPVNAHHYNALQVKVDRRMKDLLITTSYTLSRAINYDDESGNISTPANITLSKGLAGFNRTHSFVQSFVWSIPFAGSKDGIARWVLDGWQLSGIFARQSGTPLDITASATNLHAPGNTQRADMIGAPLVLGNTGPGQFYFLPSAYSTPAATLTSATGVAYAPFGNLTRNGSGLNGPGYLNLDASIFKKFKFTERVAGEIRADIFNALNHPNFNNPNTSLTSPTFGQINSTASSPRLVRFGVRIAF